MSVKNGKQQKNGEPEAPLINPETNQKNQTKPFQKKKNQYF